MVPSNWIGHVGLSLRVGDRGVRTSPALDSVAQASTPPWHRPLSTCRADAAHQVGASTRSDCPLGPNMTAELNALLLTSRLHNRSGPWQWAWMKHQRNNLWFRCCPNNYMHHKLRVNLSQTNDSWKRKHASVSISTNDGNRNTFPFPFTFAIDTETHNNTLLEKLETETCFRFHQSWDNSAKNSPAKLGQGKNARDWQICLWAKNTTSLRTV
jgi:hypothetical protein